jgi:hypothetical protein
VTVYSAVYLGNFLAFGQAYRAGGFSGRFFAGLAGLLASPSRGLFVFSPVLLASVAGAILAWRSKPELLRYLATGTISVLLYSCWGEWWGGSTFGYRIILEVAPALVLLLPLAWTGGSAGSRFSERRSSFSSGVRRLAVPGRHVYPSSFGKNLDLEPARLWTSAIPSSSCARGS